MTSIAAYRTACRVWWCLPGSIGLALGLSGVCWAAGHAPRGTVVHRVDAAQAPPPDLMVRSSELRPARRVKHETLKVGAYGAGKTRRAPAEALAPLAAHRYEVPLGDGASFRVTQPLRVGTLGDAVVLMATPGTPVVAARAGVVVALDADTARTPVSGSWERASAVTVQHEDGTLADYLFVAPGSPSVRLGQRVAAGTALAVVGRNPLYFRVRQASGMAPLAVELVNGPDGSRRVDQRMERLDVVDHSGAPANWLRLQIIRSAGPGAYLLLGTMTTALTVVVLIGWTVWLRRFARGRPWPRRVHRPAWAHAV